MDAIDEHKQLSEIEATRRILDGVWTADDLIEAINADQVEIEPAPVRSAERTWESIEDEVEPRPFNLVGTGFSEEQMEALDDAVDAARDRATGTTN